MGVREIGSEFWAEGVPSSRAARENEVFLLSGRTALDYVIRDILLTKKLRVFALPSYCCESMIQPFLRNGVEVRFYPPFAERVEGEFDGILLLDYFGFLSDTVVALAKSAREQGKTVLYDGTHRISGNLQVEAYAEYSICSYRKWTYCNFASAVKYTGRFLLPLLTKEHTVYASIRDEAAALKAAYICRGEGDKRVFLEKYAQAEALLEKEYADYAGIPVDIGEQMIIAKRTANANILMDGLKNLPKIRLWQNQLKEGDVPLFVPLLLEDRQTRDGLRKYLIDQKIYCPVHWPKSPLHQGVCAAVYDEELSLPCDQRYGEEDMRRIIEGIRDYFSEREV